MPPCPDSTRFDGQVLHVAVTAADGSTERFNSARDHLHSWSYAPSIPGHAGRRWAMLKTTSDDASLVYTWTGFAEPAYLEEFTGTITLTADFSDNTISGCLGCVADIVLDREHLYSALGYTG